MIEQDLATVQTSYTEEEKSAIYDELKLAEAEAIAKKKGQHNDANYTYTKFNDISNNKNMKLNRWNL